MVQAMPELVEQRQYVIVSEQCGMRAAWREKIAHEICDRQSRTRRQMLAADAFIHPRAAALVGARISIEVEAANRMTAGVCDLEEAHIRMPQRHTVTRADAYVKQAFGHVKEAGEHPRHTEIRPQLLLRDRIAAALQTLGVEA